MSAKGKGEYSRHPDYDKPKGKGKDPLGRSKGPRVGPPRVLAGASGARSGRDRGTAGEVS